MQLIVNADDFGLTRGVSYGIIECFRNGVVTSTTMICNSPFMEHAVELAKSNPGLGVGIHLMLTSGYPLTEGKSFCKPDGSFYSLADNKFATYDLDEVAAELEAQIEKFYATGLMPTHFDAHHNMQSLSFFTPIFVQLAQKYNVPMRRLTRPYTNTEEYSDEQFEQAALAGVVHTQAINKDFYGDQATNTIFCGMLEQLVASGAQTAESYAHPGFVEPILLEKSSYNMQRVQELDVLTSQEVQAKITELGITLVNYGTLQK